MSANISRQRDLSRRSFLKAGGTIVATAAAAQTLRASTALGQSPKRGGTLSLRLWDPPHFDPHLIVAYKTHIIYSFTHSRLVKHKAGPSVQPGTFSIEGDLAESWTQPNETTYVFKLRSGIRWHTKPPVNGRELTAEDIVYSVERFRTVKGNANAYMLTPVDKVEAVDRSTWPCASLQRNASRSGAISRGARRPSAPAHGCSIRIGRIKA